MAMPISLSEATEKILKENLKLNKLSDILEREYLDITTQADVDRDKTKIYCNQNRGSVRLNRGLFYTAKEFEEWTNKVKQLPLP